ncbi:MAG: hypothetical protein JNJ60_00890, partial [Rhodocyclaceae bacterium]|nr:hypothetical protein [Rhodocyclaceae bacterium]
MPATDTAASWLQAFHSGADLPGGLAFRAALEQAGLDYTPDSLTRLDRLLRQIRRERAPEQRAFMADAAQRNFVVLSGFYFGTLIARYTLQRVDWYHHDELDQVLAADEVLKLPHSLSTSLVCTFRRDGELAAWFLPLKPLVNILFRSADTPELLAAGDALMQRALAAPLLQAPGADAPAAAAADYAAAALQRIGALAGAELANAVRAWLAEGRPADPQLLYENSAGRRRAARSWARVDADPVDTCRARLAYPEPDCVGAALSYCGHINL